MSVKLEGIRYRVSEVVMSHKNVLARNFWSKMQTQLKFFSKNIST